MFRGLAKIQDKAAPQVTLPGNLTGTHQEVKISKVQLSLMRSFSS